MVQKSFIALLEHDIRKQGTDSVLVDQLHAIYKTETNKASHARKVSQLLLKERGTDWTDKCERSLYLAKRLGNIYTGSLYNGLLSLICDESIDLQGKNIMMFSYGSGCAASMFVLRVRRDYKHI